MKKFSKLIPAFCMLLISAMLMGTSTFAWFSMNTQVTATGMQIQAKSNETYLLIGTENNVETIQTAKLTSANAGMGTATLLYPSRVKGDATSLTDATLKFEYTSAKDASASAADTNATYTEVETNKFDNYVVKKTFYVTIQKGAAVAKNLKVKSVTFKDLANTGVACVITSASATGVINATSDINTVQTLVLANEVTDATVVAVNVYLYINGEHTNIYTNNINNLKAGSVEIEFQVD